MVKQTKSTDPQDNVVKETITGPVSAAEYVAIVPMTFEERYRMYMRCKKEELAKMLATRDEYDNLMRGVPQQPYVIPQPMCPGCPRPCNPYEPYNPFGPVVTYCTNTTVDGVEKSVNLEN